jgi:hypothetical protein
VQSEANASVEAFMNLYVEDISDSKQSFGKPVVSGNLGFLGTLRFLET